MRREKLPPLLAVRAFEAVARLGSVTRAGHELGLSQPGVSYQLKILETHVRQPLLMRAGRLLVPTEVGERVASRVTRAFDSIGQAFEEARAGQTNSLAISCSLTFGSNWLGPRIGRFQLANPDIATRIGATDAVANLHEGEADVAIRNAPSRWPGLTCDPLFASPIMPLAAPSMIQAHGPCKSVDDVLALPRSASADPWWSMWGEQVAGIPTPKDYRTHLSFDNQSIDGSAALAGTSVAMLNVLLWKDQIEAGLLEPVLKRVGFGRGIYWLCYPRSRAADPSVTAFRTWIMAEAAIAVRWFHAWCGDTAGARMMLLIRDADATQA